LTPFLFNVFKVKKKFEKFPAGTDGNGGSKIRATSESEF